MNETLILTLAYLGTVGTIIICMMNANDNPTLIYNLFVAMGFWILCCIGITIIKPVIEQYFENKSDMENGDD